MWVSEGVTFSAVGSTLTAADMLANGDAHLIRAEGERLRPYLERLSRGERVTQRVPNSSPVAASWGRCSARIARIADSASRSACVAKSVPPFGNRVSSR